MNLKKLTALLFAGVTATTPLVTNAQNPTILQGNYVSNVFGQANFVLNPNAQTNIANVGATNATRTRSTTTPLVATTEFNVTVTSANGTITWATRSFDEGMKNQNCEARFSYRGFQATSKAQIKQGANVVAELTLTPSATDPRIASINFPCGDLSAATTFVITDSATLSGTNEIGGIYVGLATNQANVAQAEFVGAVKWAATANCTWLFSNTTAYTSFAVDSDCTTPSGANIEGSASAPATKIPAIKFTNLKPGRYLVTASGSFQSGGGSPSTLDFFQAYFRFFDGTNAAKNENRIYSARINGADGPSVPLISGEFEYTTTQSNLTIQIQAKTNIASPSAAYAIVDAAEVPIYISVYRFPLSSELVVTPETQNWFIDAYQGNDNPALSIATVATRTEITNANLTFTPKAGSAPVATVCSGTNAPPALSTSPTTCASGNESLGLTFNIPAVGYYEACAEFTSYVDAAANGAADMTFFLEETGIASNTNITTNKSVAKYNLTQSSGNAISTPLKTCEIFNFTSVGQKAIRLMYMQSVGGTVNANYILLDNARQRNLKWTVKPVTNASNSALYVQGPVKAAATGAAIPAGYVGEVLDCSFSSITITTTNTTLCTITATPGNYLVTAEADAQKGSSTRLWGMFDATTGTATYVIPSFTNANDWATTVSNLAVFRGTTTIRVTAAGTINFRAISATANATDARGRIQMIRLN